ncbi:GGDEF domain-containing protein [Paenibacillus sp. UNC451MF]|uniref:GGDEF domain-containing protein n=1 Tax=Paenibacillus sp. UNC451MF TaxID=1449063 RepID=UPI00048BF053|nr:GGDEF domain-containing protein [Paenibacillus sp. UNC451MF]
MKSRFRLKLTITLILFAILISCSIAITDHQRLREQAIHHKLDQVEQNEKMAKYALETIEKAYFVFGDHIAEQLKENSIYLLNKYDENPSFDQWDFDALHRRLSSDIYIIDADNRIIYSSFKADLGLDFGSCCKKLAQVLSERRMSGEFFHDGIDIEQKTGKIKKYSYMATRDKKYIIQLGYALQNENIFKKFNFFKTLEELLQKYPSMNEINILNTGGFSLGEPADGRKLSGERRKAFDQTLQTGQTTEWRGEWRNEPAIYRYVHYISEYDIGTTKNKVLEIIYKDKDLQSVLDQNKKTFLVQLFIVFIISIGLSFIISRWVARPMYLAFHDSLTGLSNRAAFEEMLAMTISQNKGITALLMIDLDNFKLVNDRLGHDKGDHLLKCVAQCLRTIARKEDIAIRLGGDEFVIIMPSVTRPMMESMATRIIEEIGKSTAREIQLDGDKVTVSIGISLSPEHGVDPDALCKSADIALYRSKEKGKNQYHIYTED